MIWKVGKYSSDLMVDSVVRWTKAQASGDMAKFKFYTEHTMI